MKQINMLESPVRQVFFSYLVPSISATLVTSIYILADTMMIGRGVGGSGIAAMNILLPLYNTYFGIGMMCGVGGSVLFGLFYGGTLCGACSVSSLSDIGKNLFQPSDYFYGKYPTLK